MKFLIDEDVPVAALKALQKMGHDSARVELSSSDIENANRAKNEGRILVSCDKDFVNSVLFPPKEFDIIHTHIHPRNQAIFISSLQRLLETVPPEKLKGLTVLMKDGQINVPPES